MSLIKPKRIEDYLIFYLKKGPIKCLDLLTEIQNDRPGTTKQAVYSALRILRHEEQIIVTKGIATLNVSWINEMTIFFDSAKKQLHQNSNSGSFLDLEDNERIKYYFHTTQKADVFWTHAYYLLMEQLQVGKPVFLYNQHEWFLIARNKNELDVIASAVNKNHQFLMTAGRNTALDKHVSKYFDGTNSQYNMLLKPLFKEKNYYINIFGDFLIEAWIDKKVAEEIENIYQESSMLDEETKERFQKALSKDGRIKIVISRNHKKAERLKKSLRKGFAIKKQDAL